MAEIVTGFLHNLAGLPIGAKDPILLFTARQPSIGDSAIYITDPIRTPVDASTGAFSVALIASMTTTPPTLYDAYVEWRDPDFFAPGAGMSRKDILQGLIVPVGGGDISDILAGQLGPGWYWLVEDADTIPPGGKLGDLVWDTTTDIITILSV